MSATDNLLGIGIYTPAQAAHYARVPTQLVNRWIHGSKQGDAVITPQLKDSSDRIVTFLDWVQTLAIRAIRRHKKIPLPKIREAINVARRDLEIEFPFAMNHKIYLFDDKIFIDVKKKRWHQLTGKFKGQGLFPIAEPFMTELSYSDEGLAKLYQAFSHGRLSVIMDPTFHFGHPYVDSCKQTTQALYHAYKTEGSQEAAAEVLGVTVEEVGMAIRYEDYLGGPIAA